MERTCPLRTAADVLGVAFVLVLVALFVANIGFVGFDRLGFATKRRNIFRSDNSP
jgi:hypothetical protein